MWNPEKYLEALHFAADAHAGQKVPGTSRPYLVHLASVAAEVMTAMAREEVANPDLAVQCALLHDVLEDTAVSYAELTARFGPEVANGVQALSKDPAIGDKRAQLLDSLRRIRACPCEVWMVKLADRITNLQPPPAFWEPGKIAAYHEEAGIILRELGAASGWLASRLAQKMRAYEQFLQ